MGIEKTKQRARDIMYWPDMNAKIADTVSNSFTCQEYRKSNQKEPLLSTQPTAMEMVGTDLFMWNNYNYVLIVDYCSRYFEVAKLENTRASTVITHTKSVFARHGIPREVRSDNGPKFSSKEYGQFAKNLGIQTRYVKSQVSTV
jgi:transposase InsO family protein